MRQNSSQVMTVGLLSLTLFIAAVAGGCSCSSSGGGDDSRLSKEAKEERDRVARAEAAEVEAERRKAAKKENLAAQRKPPPPPAPILKTPTKQKPARSTDASPSGKQNNPARPKDTAKWSPDDYLAAKKDHDPQSASAVVSLGKRNAGQQSTAELLAKLLEPPAPDQKLFEAIIAALAANGTPHARQTLENLVIGTKYVPADQTLAAAALKALLGHTWPSEDNASLRVRLAKHVVAPETSPALYDQLWAGLKEPREENLPAQIVLFQSNRPDELARKTLEQLLASQSAGALGRMLGFRSSRQDESRGKASPAIAPYRLAEQLWSPDCAAAIERRLHSVDALNKDAKLVAFAGTIPEPSLRATLLRTLQRHWSEGPKGLESLVASEGPAVEPGFLLLVKMLPRKDSGKPAGGKETRGSNANRSAAATKSTKNTEILNAKRLQEETSQQWMKFSHNLVRSMCGRFFAAAQARQADGSQTESEADDRFPVKLHPNADVIAVYRLDWPGGLSGKIAAAPSLRVCYVRLELKAQPSRVMAFYRRQLPDCDQRDPSSGGWLDSVNSDKNNIAARSVDVLVTKIGANAAGLSDREQELTVDILSIECEIIEDRSSLSANR